MTATDSRVDVARKLEVLARATGLGNRGKTAAQAHRLLVDAGFSAIAKNLQDKCKDAHEGIVREQILTAGISVLLWTEPGDNDDCEG